ncbi:hypothetical protein BDR26DRAFT_941845 [Obelidium mucronatum]|nr:hypothetical protein BDR26DRAFT_941845 [Obelidium mucronatum]
MHTRFPSVDVRNRINGIAMKLVDRCNADQGRFHLFEDKCAFASDSFDRVSSVNKTLYFSALQGQITVAVDIYSENMEDSRLGIAIEAEVDVDLLVILYARDDNDDCIPIYGTRLPELHFAISHKDLWDEIKHLQDKPVFNLGCDNMGVYLAAVKGSSRNPDVNNELKEVFAVARKNNVHLQFYWLDTKANHLSDAITREEEENDFVLADDLFMEDNERFGPFTVDAMASRYDCPNSSFINILAWTASERDRTVENLYLYPPFAMIRVVLQHLLTQNVNFTMIIPRNYENYGITTKQLSFGSFLLVGTDSVKAATALRSYSNMPKPLLFDLHAFQFKAHKN